MTTWLIEDTTHKLRPRLFWQVHITELITWSFYTLCMLKPTLQTFTFKCKLCLIITHIHIHNRNVTKTIYYAVNVLSTEAELFAIKCGINQATNISGISKVVVITDLLHTTRRIFNSSLHSYQIYGVAISNKYHIQVHSSRNYISAK